jgi:hypothetical protein
LFIFIFFFLSCAFVDFEGNKADVFVFVVVVVVVVSRPRRLRRRLFPPFPFLCVPFVFAGEAGESSLKRFVLLVLPFLLLVVVVVFLLLLLMLLLFLAAFPFLFSPLLLWFFSFLFSATNAANCVRLSAIGLTFASCFSSSSPSKTASPNKSPFNFT